ncbi:hypothetical protein TNCV_2718581 [Trichonephila clavipes]|nr:hypothetical protein TNCV_2718581 [Trichonephila clavipes]
MRNVGIVELQVRVREFMKPLLFHVLEDLEYPCILGVDFIRESKIVLDFDRKSLEILDSQVENIIPPVEKDNLENDLTKTGYDRVKQGILDYHVEKMLKECNIIPIQFPYASPVVLYRKNNGLTPDNSEGYRFTVDYRKLNAITKYPRYSLPLIEDLITNIPHTAIMSSLDLPSGYFQLDVNPSDEVKTAFVRKNDTYAFKRMPFGLSGVAPNFQKAVDILLKPVIGRFV